MWCQLYNLGVLILFGGLNVVNSNGDIQIQGCSFKSGECTYNIQLSNINSHSCKSSYGQALGQTTPVPIPLDSLTQNDVATKVQSIEKSFEQVKEKHEVRLRELENSVRDLLGLDKKNYDPTKHGPDTTGKPVNLFEDKLMTKLTTEFEMLRGEIKRKESSLLNTEIALNDTKRTLKQAHINLINVNQQLLRAEKKISSLNREKSVLKNQLKDKSNKLETTEQDQNVSDSRITSMENQIQELTKSENRLQNDLSICRQHLNHSHVHSENAKVRYSELKRRNDVVKHQLKIREIELINCYTSKTATHCGFEDPFMCGFTQTNDSDVFDWTRAKGKTPSANTGPSKDHTCGTDTGHFMFIEASARAPGNNALLISPMYRGMEGQCVGFHYHMMGSHIGTLQVYAKAHGFQVSSKWGAYGNQGDVWSIARLAIPRQLARAGYQIVFEGITEKGYQGDIAIDDITVEDGGCPVDSNAVPVVVEVDSTAIDEEGEKFARKVRRNRRRGKKKNRNSKSKKKEN